MRNGWIAVALLSMAVLGCNIKVTDSEDGDNVKIQMPGLDIETSSGKNVKLPADFPTDVKVPEGAKPVAIINVQGTGVFTFELSGEALQETIDGIKAEMLAEGWEEQTSATTTDGATVVLVKGDRVAQFAANLQDQKITLVLTLGSN